jgi:hypothetical protein
MNFYFKDRAGNQYGPVSPDELLAIARAGRLAPDCLVWPEGGAPKAARDIPEIAAAMASPAPNTPGAGPMRGDFPVFDFFVRSLAAGVGLFLVIPAPWLGLWFYRWFASRISLPDGRRLALESAFRPAAILFTGFALSIVAPSLYGGAVGGDSAAARADVSMVQLIGSIAQIGFSYLILRWFVDALRSEDGALRIAFIGGFPGFLGWNLLLALSIFTIIGWAWVARFMGQWICRNISGSHRFEFVGAGLEILWRTLVVAVGAILIVPIPWLIAWFYAWLVSQIVATPAAEAPDRNVAA